MNKFLSRIAIAIVSIAMVIGGVSIATTYGKEQTEVAYADGEFYVGFELDTDIEMQPNSQYCMECYITNAIGDVTYESVSSNLDVASVVSLTPYNGYHHLLINSGSVPNASTVITVTFKDMGGESGCHVVTRSINVSVSGYYLPGDRILTQIESGEELVLLANGDKTKFIYVDVSTLKLKITDDVKKASLFAHDENGFFRHCFYNYPGDGFVYIRRQSDVCISTMDCTPIIPMNDEMIDEDHLGVLWGYVNDYFLTISQNKVQAIHTNAINNGDLLYAYSAVETEPGIVSSETSVDVIEGDSVDVSATAAFIDDVDYEILSGASSIEEVTITEANNLYGINIHVEASSTCGTAVIRVKDANNDSIYTDITVVVKNTTKLSVGTISTQAKLSYEYARDGEEYDISNVAIRFGGMIDKDTWDILDNKFGIDAFGVMLSNTNNIEQRADEKINNAGSLETSITNGLITDTDIKVFSSNQTPAEEGNYYFWNLYKQINETVLGLTREYTAVAFILTSDGDVVFFDEITTSAARLARELNTANPELDATLDGSLSHLANLDQEN